MRFLQSFQRSALFLVFLIGSCAHFDGSRGPAANYSDDPFQYFIDPVSYQILPEVARIPNTRFSSLLNSEQWIVAESTEVPEPDLSIKATLLPGLHFHHTRLSFSDAANTLLLQSTGMESWGDILNARKSLATFNVQANASSKRGQLPGRPDIEAIPLKPADASLSLLLTIEQATDYEAQKMVWEKKIFRDGKWVKRGAAKNLVSPFTQTETLKISFSPRALSWQPISPSLDFAQVHWTSSYRSQMRGWISVYRHREVTARPASKGGFASGQTLTELKPSGESDKGATQKIQVRGKKIVTYKTQGEARGDSSTPVLDLSTIGVGVKKVGDKEILETRLIAVDDEGIQEASMMLEGPDGKSYSGTLKKKQSVLLLRARAAKNAPNPFANVAGTYDHSETGIESKQASALGSELGAPEKSGERIYSAKISDIKNPKEFAKLMSELRQKVRGADQIFYTRITDLEFESNVSALPGKWRLLWASVKDKSGNEAKIEFNEALAQSIAGNWEVAVTHSTKLDTSYRDVKAPPGPRVYAPVTAKSVKVEALDKGDEIHFVFEAKFQKEEGQGLFIDPTFHLIGPDADLGLLYPYPYEGYYSGRGQGPLPIAFGAQIPGLGGFPLFGIKSLARTVSEEWLDQERSHRRVVVAVPKKHLPPGSYRLAPFAFGDSENQSTVFSPTNAHSIVVQHSVPLEYLHKIPVPTLAPNGLKLALADAGNRIQISFDLEMKKDPRQEISIQDTLSLLGPETDFGILYPKPSTYYSPLRKGRLPIPLGSQMPAGTVADFKHSIPASEIKIEMNDWVDAAHSHRRIVLSVPKKNLPPGTYELPPFSISDQYGNSTEIKNEGSSSIHVKHDVPLDYSFRVTAPELAEDGVRLKSESTDDGIAFTLELRLKKTALYQVIGVDSTLHLLGPVSEYGVLYKPSEGVNLLTKGRLPVTFSGRTPAGTLHEVPWWGSPSHATHRENAWANPEQTLWRAKILIPKKHLPPGKYELQPFTLEDQFGNSRTVQFTKDNTPTVEIIGEGEFIVGPKK